MLRELTIKEVESILSKDSNVYGIDSIGSHVYKIQDLKELLDL